MYRDLYADFLGYGKIADFIIIVVFFPDFFNYRFAATLGFSWTGEREWFDHYRHSYPNFLEGRTGTGIIGKKGFGVQSSVIECIDYLMWMRVIM
jgi:hypothetical protein